MGQAAIHVDGTAAQPGEAGGGSMNLLLPGLRPVRRRFGFAATPKDPIEKSFEMERTDGNRSDRRNHRLEKSAQDY
jgi:hypothetical protein